MHVQVRKGKQNKTVRFQQVLSVPDFSCDDFLAINPSDAYLNSIDNGQSGHFTLDKYDNNMSCFIDFGSQCNGAVDIELTHLSVEDLDTETCEYDYAKFAYTASDGTQMYTDDFCGCMHDLDVDYSLHYSHDDFYSHPSCDYFVYMDFFFAKSADQLTETLLGTDFKFIFVSDSDTPGGKVSVEWQCASITTTATTTTTTTVPPTATNTVEMADALMTGGFSPNLAIDYGCAGRGAFDAFSQSLGQPVDAIDHAFFAWKKCVQCASDGDKTTIGSYDYDTTGDSCGPKNRALCECDRTLIKTLANASPPSTPVLTSACTPSVIRHGELVCCNWNTHYWAVYNTNSYCCGADGIKEIGLC